MKRIQDPEFLKGVSERGLRQFYKEDVGSLPVEGYDSLEFHKQFTTERYLRSLIGRHTKDGLLIDGYLMGPKIGNTVTEFVLIKKIQNDKD